MFTTVPSAQYWLKLIEVERRIYASENWAIIGLDDGLSPVRRQAIIYTNGGLLSSRSLGIYISKILIKIH